MGNEGALKQQKHSFASKLPGLTAQQKKAIVGLSIYTQPIIFYKCIEDRRLKEKYFLRRNLSYSSKSDVKLEHDGSFDKHRRLDVTLQPSEAAPPGRPNAPSRAWDSQESCTLLLAWCTPQEEGLMPVSAHFLRLQREPGSHTFAASLENVPSLGQANQLCLLFVLLDQGFDIFLRKKYRKVSVACTACSAFGGLLQWKSGAGTRVVCGMLQHTEGGRVSLRESVLSVHLQRPAKHRIGTPNGKQPCSRVIQVHHTQQASESIQAVFVTSDRPAEAGPSTPQDAGVVHFCYRFSNGLSYVVERTEGWECFVCQMHCRDFLGLQAHLLASHALFRYQASDCYPQEERCVIVESPEYLFDKNQFFAPSGIWERGQPLESQRASWHVWWATRGESTGLQVADASGLIGSCVRGCEKHSFSPTSSIVQSVLAAYAEHEELLSSSSADLVSDDAGPLTKVASPPLEPAPQAILVEGSRIFHANSHQRWVEAEARAVLAYPHACPDSDDDEDLLEWEVCLRRRIAKVPGLTQGERDFMFDWNSFIREHPIVADVQLPELCFHFAAVLASKPLSMERRRAFTLHLLNLHEYGLVCAADLDRCLLRLDDSAAPRPQGPANRSAARLGPVTARPPGRPKVLNRPSSSGLTPNKRSPPFPRAGGPESLTKAKVPRNDCALSPRDGPRPTQFRSVLNGTALPAQSCGQLPGSGEIPFEGPLGPGPQDTDRKGCAARPEGGVQVPIHGTPLCQDSRPLSHGSGVSHGERVPPVVTESPGMGGPGAAPNQRKKPARELDGPTCLGEPRAPQTAWESQSPLRPGRSGEVASHEATEAPASHTASSPSHEAAPTDPPRPARVPPGPAVPGGRPSMPPQPPSAAFEPPPAAPPPMDASGVGRSMGLSSTVHSTMSSTDFGAAPQEAASASGEILACGACPRAAPPGLIPPTAGSKSPKQGGTPHTSVNHGSMNQVTSINHGSVDHSSVTHASVNHGSINHNSVIHASANHDSVSHSSPGGRVGWSDSGETQCGGPPEAGGGRRGGACLSVDGALEEEAGAAPSAVEEQIAACAAQQNRVCAIEQSRVCGKEQSRVCGKEQSRVCAEEHRQLKGPSVQRDAPQSSAPAEGGGGPKQVPNGTSSKPHTSALDLPSAEGSSPRKPAVKRQRFSEHGHAIGMRI